MKLRDLDVLKELGKQLSLLRLEPRSRDQDLEDGLAMRIADPLWMLGRQWQFGEFNGEDNGSPILVETTFKKKRLDQLVLGSAGKRVDTDEAPPEALVEAIPYPLERDWRSRAKFGQQIEKALQSHAAEKLALRAAFPIQLPSLQAPFLPEAKTRRFIEWMSGKCVDAYPLFEACQKNELSPLLAAKGLDNANTRAAIEKIYTSYLELYTAPAPDEDCWHPRQLLHKFSIQSKDATVRLDAPDYQSGHLDWYAFDKAEVAENTTYEQGSATHLPVNLSFSSMPRKRLYEFEDASLNFNNLQVEEIDLARMMLIEFVLAYSNDWFILPLEMELGEAAWVEELKIRDVFGVTTTVKNGLGADNRHRGALVNSNPAHIWDVFKIRNHNPDQYIEKEHFLYLAPTLPHKQESAPLEELLFQRDEYANLVWGIETKLMNGLGQAVDGYDYHKAFYPATQQQESSTASQGQLHYQLSRASKVPYNWLPFVPRRLPLQGASPAPEIILRRARLARPEGAPPSYHAHLMEELRLVREEALPYAGMRVQLTRHRARWTNGRTFVWLGRKAKTGRGEGSSGLRFDTLTFK